MRAGPKGQADLTPLPWAPRLEGAEQFAEFRQRFIVTPKGTGARQPMRPRDWQLDLVRDVGGRHETGLVGAGARQRQVDVGRCAGVVARVRERH